jgi:hypothetical protein
LWVLSGLVACRFSGNASQATGPPLAQPVPLPDPVEELAASRGLQAFFEMIS